MKKMNKMYEAPVAEVIEIVNMGVLMASGDGTGNTSGGGGSGFGGFQP